MSDDLGDFMDDADDSWIRPLIRADGDRFRENENVAIDRLKELARYPHGRHEGTVMAETSDGSSPVSQRQLRDHEKLDEANRKGDLALAEQRHKEIRGDLKELKGVVKDTNQSIKDTNEALQDHAINCPAKDDVKTISKKVWYIAGVIAAAGGSGGAGIAVVLSKVLNG